MLSFETVEEKRVSTVAKLAIRAASALPECRASPVDAAAVARFLGALVAGQAWTAYARYLNSY